MALTVLTHPTCPDLRLPDPDPSIGECPTCGTFVSLAESAQLAAADATSRSALVVERHGWGDHSACPRTPAAHAKVDRS